jgi:hypothetical protein
MVDFTFIFLLNRTCATTFEGFSPAIHLVLSILLLLLLLLLLLFDDVYDDDVVVFEEQEQIELDFWWDIMMNEDEIMFSTVYYKMVYCSSIRKMKIL